MHSLATKQIVRTDNQEKQNLIKLLQFLYVHFGNDIEPFFKGEGETLEEISRRTNNDPTISHLFTRDYCNTVCSAPFVAHVLDAGEFWDRSYAE